MNRLIEKYGTDILFFLAVVFFLLWVACNPVFGEIVDVPKAREVRDQKLFGEIRSRLPRVFLGINVDSTYRVAPDGMHPDPRNEVSTTHEFTHALNSLLRHQHKRRVACYIPGGKALVIRRLNGLYEPGNPLDETCAYTCGAIRGLELGLPRRSLDSLKRADVYLKRCFVIAKDGRRRGYPDADELDAFLLGMQKFQARLTFNCLTPSPTEE